MNAETSILLAALMFSFILSMGLTRLYRHLARRVGLVDSPDGRRKFQPTAIPVAGGLAVLSSSILTLLGLILFQAPFSQYLVHEPRVLSLLGAVAIIALVGIVDDLHDLRIRHKFLGQLIAISVLLLAGDLHLQRIELFGTLIDLGPFGPLFAVFWLLGCINAINLIDGMDGLLGSLGAILFLTIATIAALNGQWFIVLIAGVFAGSLMGFLCFNLPPASIYLGDCGSMVIGMVVGTLSLHSSTKVPTALALATPITLLILPIFDTFAAIARRRLTGQSIFMTDRGHFHHCLQRRMNRPMILVMVIGFGILTAGGTIATTIWRNDWYAILASLAVVVSLIVSRLFGHAEMRLIRQRLLATWNSLGDQIPDS